MPEATPSVFGAWQFFIRSTELATRLCLVILFRSHSGLGIHFKGMQDLLRLKDSTWQRSSVIEILDLLAPLVNMDIKKKKRQC